MPLHPPMELSRPNEELAIQTTEAGTSGVRVMSPTRASRNSTLFLLQRILRLHQHHCNTPIRAQTSTPFYPRQHQQVQVPKITPLPIPCPVAGRLPAATKMSTDPTPQSQTPPRLNRTKANSHSRKLEVGPQLLIPNKPMKAVRYT